MGRVASFSVVGLDLWFNSHDHEPPHFHARKPGVWEIRIYFLTCTRNEVDFEMKWGSRPGARDIRQLASAIVECRATLLEEWATKVCL